MCDAGTYSVGETHERYEMDGQDCAGPLKALGFVFEPQMGGNCTAWGRYQTTSSAYVLITVEGGGLAPDTMDERVLVGFYSGEPDEEEPSRYEEGVLQDLVDQGVLAA